MKYVLMVLAVVALCVPAFADGTNPTVKAFVHLTGAAAPVLPTNNLTVVNELSPAPYTTVRAYVGLTDLSTGFTTISFGLNDAVAEYPGVAATQSFTNILPGNLGIGDAFVGGITLAATQCMSAPFQLFGYADYFYLGGAFAVEIIDHGNPTWARWVVDCQQPGVVNLYCVWLNGGVGGATPPAGDTECGANTPVEDATWTAIKALYR